MEFIHESECGRAQSLRLSTGKELWVIDSRRIADNNFDNMEGVSLKAKKFDGKAWTSEEKKEIAEYLINLWKEWAGI